MNNKIHLIEYFPNYLSTDSIFTKMSQLGAPWPQEVGQDMDDAYFTMYSGIKNPADFVLLHLNPDSDIANSLTIARILYGINGDNWTKLWEAFRTKYSPIENYNIQETINTTNKTDRNITRSKDLTSTVDGTQNQTTESDSTSNVDGSTTLDTTENSNGTSALEHGENILVHGTQVVTGKNDSNTTSDSNSTSSLDHGETITKEAEADEYSYGFNSVVKVPTAVQIENGSDVHSGTDTTTSTDHSTSGTVSGSTTSTTNDTSEGHSGTDTTTTQNTTTTKEDGTSKSDTVDHSTGTTDTISKTARSDNEAEDTSDSSTGSEDILRNRSGNIGQNTYQELLQQEFELWKWNFFFRVFEDVDKFLVLSVYSSCKHDFS